MHELVIILPDQLLADEWDLLSHAAESWYGTPGHCLLYAHQPPDWVALWRNPRGEAVAACFGRTGGGSSRPLILMGPTTATRGMLRELLARMDSRQVTIPYMLGPLGAGHLPWWEGVEQEFTSDWIVEVPATYEAYLATLGQTSCKHLTAYTRRFARNVPSQFTVLEGEEIRQDVVEALMELHRLRMEEMEQNYQLTPDKIARRGRLLIKIKVFANPAAAVRWHVRRLALRVQQWLTWR
jgi:hypothetical protein